MPSQTSDPLAPYPDLTLPMVEELQVFLDLVDPGLFSGQLMQLYLKYMASQPEELPADFTDMTESLSFLLQFLSRVEQELKRE
ncbi:MAG: hypothetical protein HEP71_22095 [Roseivirga sp.]|nr:hypothetical protein [Roseivirga sp.]